jgi:hypothetical protein
MSMEPYGPVPVELARHFPYPGIAQQRHQSQLTVDGLDVAHSAEAK